MAEYKKWVITTGGNRDINDIAKDLADAGLNDVTVLREIKNIIGSGDKEIVDKLRKIRGVKMVVEDSAVGIPPADKDITW